MKNKDITKNSLKQVKELIQNVQEMTSVEFQGILNKMVRFHRYSLYNQIILCFAGCSQVAGYKKWKELGRTVKKGGKAVWILAPWLKKNEKEEEDKVLFGFFSVPVFDISQTEGKPIERGMTAFSDVKFGDLKQACTRAGWIIEFKPLQIDIGGYAIAGNGMIILNSSLTEVENTGTLVHEWIHKELHGNSNGVAREVCEQQAETATYLVCKVLGIERKSAFYLKSWKLSENILKDFGKVDKVSKKIIAALKGEENATRNAATRQGVSESS